MYAYVAAATGWTWEYIGQRLTLPRLFALVKHWKQYPPVHVGVAIIAQGLGTMKPERQALPTAAAAANEEQQAQQFLALRAQMPIVFRPLPK